METRWIVFALICAGLAWLVRQFYRIDKKPISRSDRDRNLNPPDVSQGADRPTDSFIHH